MGDEPEITQFEKIPSETLPLDRTLSSSVRRKIKIAKKIKGKSLLKRKTKGLERENTVHPRMNQIVMVMNIHHQRTKVLTMAHHQNLQRKKCFRMNIPHRGFLPSLQRKRINRNLVNS